MTDSEHVPGERKVRADFVLARTRNFDSYMMGRPLASEQERYGDEFDRWLNQVKAEAWEEGYEAAGINEHEHRPSRKLTNPYTAQRHQTHKEQE